MSIFTTIRDYFVKGFVLRVFTVENLKQPRTIAGIAIAVLTALRVEVTPELQAQVQAVIEAAINAIMGIIAAWAIVSNENKAKLPWQDEKK